MFAFAFTAWTIWNQRNHVKLHLQAKLLHQVAEQSKAVMTECHTNLHVTETQPRQGREEVEIDGRLHHWDSSK